jgi:signal transduction histidine kinase
MLLEVLASHAATAISNVGRRAEIEKRHSQLALLMNSSAEMIRTTRLSQRLQKTAEAIRQLGWQRVVIRAVKDQSMELTNPEDMVTAGLTDEERKFLWTNRMPGQVWRERFGPEFERFRVGEFYHLPWSDPWVRKKFAQGTVSSRLSPEQMVDWNPQDLLYAPLRLADGRIVGILSIDDPVDGKRPTRESLAPLELFIHQAAVAIENAQLIQQLNTARNQIREYADQLELKVKQRTQELVEAQSKLIKTERLAAIGEVAAMVGHDLRNPLTGITGATYYLKMKLASRTSSKAKEMLELIDRDIEYANKIINDLLDYSKEIFLEAKETTPKAIVRESLTLIVVPKNIRVLDLTEDKPTTQVDVDKMKRVFVNIIKNAIDAMPKGGTITTTSTERDGLLEIAVADTGTGMTEDVLRKLWSPLFTTKARGMGFGLPICRRVIEAHGGNISVESAVGMGTVFKLTFPIRPKSEEGGEKVWVNVPESLLSTMTKA